MFRKVLEEPVRLLSRSRLPLAQQGVYIGEFHYLEDLARDKVYQFLYMNATSKIRGATAGFVMRPAAIR